VSTLGLTGACLPSGALLRLSGDDHLVSSPAGSALLARLDACSSVLRWCVVGRPAFIRAPARPHTGAGPVVAAGGAGRGWMGPEAGASAPDLASGRAAQKSWRQSGVRDNSFPGRHRYIALSSCPSMTELVLLAGVIGLLALIWMGLDSDDDNGGGGLMQPVLQPIRVRDRG